jgi:EmrB/QacA subfamily drug resistance transporter
MSRGRVLAVLFVGVLMGALDIAIVGPALPAIGADFGVDERALAWVVSIFIMFNVVGAPLLAKLSDRLGRRAVYASCVGLFVLGSTLVAAAPTFAVLLAGRAVQAFGAGGIFPVASAVIADVFPEEKRGRALGAIGAVFGIAFILGPILGGLLLPIGWPWLFLINVPIGIVLIGLAWRVLPRAQTPSSAPIDLAGAGVLAAALCSLALGLNRLESLWTDGDGAGLTVVCLTAGFALVALLVFIERRAADPILPPALFRSLQLRLIGAIAIAAGLVEAGMVFLPAMAVAGLGVAASVASFMLLPLVAALIVGSPTAGFLLDRRGARPVIQLGLSIVTAGLLAFGLAPFTRGSFYVAGALVGIGLSSLLGAPLRYAALAEAGPGNRGVSQGLLTLSLSAGQLGGASLIGGIASAGADTVGGLQQAMVVLAGGCAFALVASLGLRGRERPPVS